MAFKADYLIREAGINLARNFSLALAAVLTIFVSLTMTGTALSVLEGVRNANERWEDGVEFIVFMDPEAEEAEIGAMKEDLEENPQIEAISFFSKDMAFEEFQSLFAGNPELLENVTPEILPPSYRVVPRDSDVLVVEEVANSYRTRAGVLEVAFETEQLRKLQRLYRLLSRGLLLASGLLLIAAVLLILNTIVVAIRSRRREIEVQKLVGASNWFVRLPFVLEGLVQGLLGAGLAAGAVWGLVRFLNSFTQGDNPDDQLIILQGFFIEAGEMWRIISGILLGGGLIGMVGALVAVSFYLDV